ncbi:hypothetical protein RCL1_006120 [Eukaryota sp. TZLM3-RCL]
MHIILSFLLFISLVFAHYQDTACTNNAPFARGDRIPVFLRAGDKQMPFYPKMDHYAMLTGHDAGKDDIFLQNTDTEFYLETASTLNENGTVVSDYIQFTDGESFLPFVTAVINVHLGEIRSIVVDRPLPEMVSYEDKNCEEGECDPIVYLAWAGTDKNGIRLHSVDFIFSRLRAHSMRSMVDDGVGFYDSVRGRVEDLIERYKNNS